MALVGASLVHSPPEDNCDRQPEGLDGLARPVGGLIGRHTTHRASDDEPDLVMRIEHVGWVWSDLKCADFAGPHPERIQGTGVGLDAADASLRARGEALERYCTSIYSRDQFIEASAEELGADAIDLDTIPRCSKTELANTRCPLVVPDKKARMRWIRGLSLLDGTTVDIPAVMTYLCREFVTTGERICLPITTGCAAHRSVERALVAALLEVMERDAVAVTWLQRLPLPKIEIDEFPEELISYWERYQRSSANLEYFFFDATTDLGLPTVYGLQISHCDSIRTLVSCCAAMDPVDAILGTMREMAALRQAFSRPRSTPVNIEDFTDIFHGATYMGRSENAHAFDFLLKSGHKRFLSAMPRVKNASDQQDLGFLVQRLRDKSLSAYAVELSSDEALRVGMRVVRAVIPGLQPLSFNYRARYLGHPRVYQAARDMGYTVHTEAELNNWPQPFA